MVGRFSDAKDQSTLIRAMSEVPEDIHLLLVGEGPLMEKCKKLADMLSMSERVHFLGFRQDIPRILKTVDIVVLSSYWEGLSLVSIEGLASGKPFIASKVPGLEEIVDNHGLLFEQGNDKELSSLIEKLFTDKQFENDISRSCLKRAENYEIKNMLTKTIKLYKDNRY